MHLVVTDTEVEVYSANWEREEAEQYNRAYIERYFRTQNAESRQWTEVTGQGFSLVMQGYAGDPLRDPSFQSYILPFSPLLMKPPKTNHRIGVPKNKLP